MPNPLALYDFNNPTIIAPKPTSGSRVNWISEPYNPGLKPIVDQLYDQLTFFFDQSDATQAGKGLPFDCIANRAVRPENVRQRIDQPFKGTLFTIDNGAGAGFVQNDGQTPILKPIVPVFQVLTNWRNFQPGVDNVTTEIDIVIDRAYFSNQGNMQPPTSSYSNTTQGQIGGNDRNIKIYTEVGSSAAMTDAVLVSKDAYYGYTNYSPSEPPLGGCIIKIVDKTPKLYQNPFYRITLRLEKTSIQTPGIQMALALQGLVTVTTKATNTSM